jgi:putative flippase GtrA
MRRHWRYEFFLFGIAGTVGFVVDAAVLHVAHFVFLINLVLSQLLAYFIAVYCTWLINRRLAFVHLATENKRSEFSRYLMATGVGAILNNGTYLLAIWLWALADHYPVVAVALGSLAGMGFNFVATRGWVYGKKHRISR